MLMEDACGMRPAMRGESDAPAELELRWVEESRRGDLVSFNRLVLHWEKAIYNFSLRLLRNREEAADATQEIFLSCYRNIRRFRGECRFSTWLYRIAANHCLSRLRKRNRKPIRLEEMEPRRVPIPSGQGSNPEAGLMEEERRARVARMLQSLPENYRVVLELKFYQELTFEQIGEILGLSDSTAKSRFYTALELLKRKLQGNS